MSENYFNYQSIFSWRYGSDQMRSIWSEHNKRLLWRKIWLALAQVQHEAGLVSKKELADIVKHEKNIDIPKALKIEKEIKHDLMAEVKTFASQCKIGGGKIHLGATSMDIVDNADTLRLKQSLDIVRHKILEVIGELVEKIKQYKATICMGYTHLQPAEPTTLGYRFCQYAYDLYTDLLQLEQLDAVVLAKGIKGAVGTSASYVKLLENSGLSIDQFEKKVMGKLGLKFAPVATQTYPRKTDYLLLSTLASIAQSSYKYAFDLRLLQSPGFGELSEGFGKKQVGSSAMPFKKNPITAEKICSLARYVSTLPNTAWENASNSLLERTLDDSANRRIIFPNAFLAIDEILTSYMEIVKNLEINKTAITRNLDKYGVFSVTESLMMEAVTKGADRQEMHEILRSLSMTAWKKINEGENNPLKTLLFQDKQLGKFLKRRIIEKLISKYEIGIAIHKCEETINLLKNEE